jgi:hypothetical protein
MSYLVTLDEADIRSMLEISLSKDHAQTETQFLNGMVKKFKFVLYEDGFKLDLGKRDIRVGVEATLKG